MTELLTAAQMQSIEQAAITAGKVTGLDLMERAGRGVVEAVFKEWPTLAAAPHRAVVLCGPGNNGGDGFVVARLLKQRGWDVEVFLYGMPDRLPPDARTTHDRWREIGAVTLVADPRDADSQRAVIGAISDGDVGTCLVVEALFGTGLTRDVAGWGHIFSACVALQDKCRMTIHRVAVDMPAGVCSDSGRVLGHDPGNCAFRADLTVSFHSEKLGHALSQGPAHCGRVVVCDIGLQEGGAGAVARVDQPGAHVLTKDPGHKYSHGHALILSGGPGATGAARLAARGALRIGAGLVTLGVPPAAQLEVAGHVTAVMLARAGDAAALAELLGDERINALCLGPGMGVARARDLVPVALNAGRFTVLDADALTACSDDPDRLFALLHERCILTPHGGEFARLFPDIAARLDATPERGPAFSKVDATREAARRAGCVVLFKGPDTVIAAPDGRCSLHSAAYDRAAPWLATAGAGDVLAGFIAGLLARGLDPLRAAETAAWLHVDAARRFGAGLIAEDLPEELPRVFRALGL